MYIRRTTRFLQIAENEFSRPTTCPPPPPPPHVRSSFYGDKHQKLLRKLNTCTFSFLFPLLLFIYFLSLPFFCARTARTFLHTLNNTRDTRIRRSQPPLCLFSFSVRARYWRHVPRARVNALPAHGPKDKSMQMTYDIRPPTHPGRG